MGNIFGGARQGFCRFSEMPASTTGKKRSLSPSVQAEEQGDTTPMVPKRVNCEEDVRERPIELTQFCQEGYIINNRYRVMEKLGAGTFGMVVEVKDIQNGGQVALKISKDLYGEEEVKSEAKFLKRIMSWDDNEDHSIIRVFDEFYWGNRYCITVELMALNLSQFIRYYRNTGLGTDETKEIIYQILDALDFLSQRRIVHCDLKPHNIMMKSLHMLTVKIIDFGSAEFTGALVGAKLTYMQTRCYRAPEVILGVPPTPAIDMWSVGCIMAELHAARVLFRGLDDDEQMYKIMEALGMPPYSLLLRGINTYKYFEKTSSSRRGIYRPLPFANKFPVELASVNLRQKLLRKNFERADGGPPGPAIFEKYIIELIMQMLNYDVNKRVTPAEAKEHILFL